MNLLKKIITNFKYLNIKTIWFNFKYFKFKTAIKLPILIHSKTNFLKTKGSVVLLVPPKFGMVKFGYGGAIFDLKKNRNVWQLDGVVVFKGSAIFGNGITLSVINGAKVTFGEKFSIGSDSKILSRKSIEFGKSCLLSWGITLMDTDFHSILNSKKIKTNEPKSIKINNHVWIGSYCSIYKGVQIADETVIAAGSTIIKSILESNSIIASGKQRVVKNNINWEE